MAPPSGIRIGRTATALAVAVALGAAVLSLMPGQAEAREPVDTGELCDFKRWDGHIDFYLPAEFARDNYGHWKYCGGDGKWHSPVRTLPTPQGPRVGAGGFR
jgi:hypothetical protein